MVKPNQNGTVQIQQAGRTENKGVWKSLKMYILKLFKSIYTLFTFVFNISCVKKMETKIVF